MAEGIPENYNPNVTAPSGEASGPELAFSSVLYVLFFEITLKIRINLI